MSEAVAEPHAVPTRFGPATPGLATFDGHVQSSRDPAAQAVVAGQRVLVVVGGRSAGPLALALWEGGASVSLSVDRPVVLVSQGPNDGGRMQYQPFRGLVGRLRTMLLQGSAPDLRPWGLEAPRGDPQRALATSAAWPLVGAGVVTLVRQGAIHVFPGVDTIAGSMISFSDGRRDRFDRIVLASD